MEKPRTINSDTNNKEVRAMKRMGCFLLVLLLLAGCGTPLGEPGESPGAPPDQTESASPSDPEEDVEFVPPPIPLAAAASSSLSGSTAGRGRRRCCAFP